MTALLVLELLVVTIVLICIGLYARIRDLEKRLDIFDKWADWLEEQVFNQQDVSFTLEGDKDGKSKSK